MRIIFILICYLLSQEYSFSQSRKLSFGKLSGPEKWWVIFHPFVANKARKITEEARRVAEEMKKDTMLDGDANGGQVDAFRHAYWMTLLSEKMCYRKALSLGRAHEKGNYRKFKRRLPDDESAIPDSISGVMDLFNNTIGVEISKENKGADIENLKIAVKNAVLSGRLKKLSKNRNGQPLDCDGKKLDMSLYQTTWNTPQCLVSSAFQCID